MSSPINTSAFNFKMYRSYLKSVWVHLTIIAMITLLVVLVLSTKTFIRLPVGSWPSEFMQISTDLNPGSTNRSSGERRKAEIFAFVPNGIRACQDLFRNRKFLVKPFSKAYRAFNNYTKTFHVTEGYVSSRIEQMLVYIQLVKAPFVRTVCETGFNAGHSAFIWLEANPKVHVYSFDIGVHPYSRQLAGYLSKMYPGRLDVSWGDSRRTLPLFHERRPDIRCDLLVIDGGHTESVCQSDFDAFYKMANVDNIVLLDNYPDSRLDWMTSLGSVWEGAKRRGQLSEIFSCSYQPNDPHGFSVGRFNIQRRSAS